MTPRIIKITVIYILSFSCLLPWNKSARATKEVPKKRWRITAGVTATKLATNFQYYISVTPQRKLRAAKGTIKLILIIISKTVPSSVIAMFIAFTHLCYLTFSWHLSRKMNRPRTKLILAEMKIAIIIIGNPISMASAELP